MQFSITEKQMSRIGSLQTDVVNFYLVAHVDALGCFNTYLKIGLEM